MNLLPKRRRFLYKDNWKYYVIFNGKYVSVDIDLTSWKFGFAFNMGGNDIVIGPLEIVFWKKRIRKHNHWDYNDGTSKDGV